MSRATMDGRVVVVTGANSGIGRATAAQLGALGARVVMVCRSAERGREAQEALRREVGRDAFELVLADLAEMAQVRRAAGEIRARHPRLDVLVNNAGVYLPRRHVTSEGLEAMFALNHLAPFVLTHALAPALERARGGARVITVSSEGHRMGRIDLGDLQAERHFGGLRQYCNTKLANILFTRELARRWNGRGVVAHCYHPGGVATGFSRDEIGWFSVAIHLVRPLLRSADKAARTATLLASSPEVLATNGRYFMDGKERTPSRAAQDETLALRLWEQSERLAGLDA